MDALIRSFVQDNGVVVASIVISGITTYFVTRHFLARRSPRMVFATWELQSRAHPGVRIEFQGQEVETLDAIRLAFWNAGRKEIRGEDIPEAARPAVRFCEGARVLSVDLGPHNRANGVQYVTGPSNPNVFRFWFDYLNHDEGFGAEILLARPSPGSPTTIDLDLSIKGSEPAIVEDWRGGQTAAVVVEHVLIIGLIFIGAALASIWYDRPVEALVFLGISAAIAASARSRGLRLWPGRFPKWVRQYLAQPLVFR